MKTNFRFLALSAAILSMFTACQREELEQNQKPEALTHSVTFVAGAPETKTTVDIRDGETAKFAWTDGDKNRISVYENGKVATKTECGLADGVMTIKATFEGSTAPKNASYVAVVSSSNDGQIMSAAAYDESADILVSKAVNSFDGENGVLLQFKREVAIAKMTLKGLDAGEVVNMVTVSSTSDIAGSYGVNGWASPAKTSLEISSALHMAGEGYSIVANEAGEAVVWFTCIPQDATTLTVKVEAADCDTYTKKFSKPITLTRGDVKGFGVEMVKDVVAKPWVAVDLADIDETMPLVITMATTDKTYALSLTGTDDNALGTSKAPKAIEVSVVDGKLSEEPSSDILWNIANNNGNLTIYPNGVTNEWLYTTNRNDGVRLGTNTSNGYVWSIDATSGYLKANATSSTVRYLGVYTTTPDWRAYDETTGNIANQTLRFYSNSITEDPTVPKLSVTPTSKTWKSEETDAAVFTVTTNAEGEKDWTVSPTTLDWATIAIDKSAGKITVTPNDANTTKTAREATLTVTHSAGTLTKTISLKQSAAGAVTSIEFSQTYSYGLKDWSLTEYTDKSSYYLVPSGKNPSVATISSIFTKKTIQSDVVITLNVATFGSGSNPSAQTFSIYNDSGCTTPVTAAQSGTLPTSSLYTNVVYTVKKEDATALTSNLAIKITKPGKQIRLKSIQIKFSYSN